MATKRYNRPFLLPEHLHCEGLPLEIAAGALLVDNTSNNALAQLKMVSFSDSVIKAVKVVLQPEDTRGEALGDEVSYQYLDLDVNRGEFFGQKTPIPLPDQTSRSFRICDVEVIYSDNVIASSNGSPWTPLPDQEALKASISDEELLKQYRLDYGEKCQYHLQEFNDIWRCVCGAINRKDEGTCHDCGQELVAIRNISLSDLESHKQARLEHEELERIAQAERERAEKEEAEKAAAVAKKKTRRIATIAGALIVVLVIGFFVANATIVPAGKYNDAIRLAESGSYAEAVAAFEELGDYKDAKSKITECLAELIGAGKPDEAFAAANNSGLDDPEEQFALAEREAISSANVGDVVAYGKYNTGDLIEWIVLEKDGDCSLLLSKYVFSKTALNEEPSYNDDWTKILLREVLKDKEELDNTFSSQEQQYMLKREHVYDGEYDSSTKAYKPGTEKTCEDKLFLLNQADVEKYFPDPKSRITSFKNGSEIAWWLSDVAGRHKQDGGYTAFHAISWKDGDVVWWGEMAELGLRPAMWVSCNKPENGSE